jgi:hypothetical protein
MICAECDNEFEPRNGNQKKFCSRKCSLKPNARRLQEAGYPMAHYRLLRAQRAWLLPVWWAKARAKKANLPFSLTEEWAINRWTGHCEMTGLKFEIAQKGHKRSIWSPSIDRIAPTKGYTQDNCRFVLFGINSFKHAGTDEDIYRIAEALMANKPLPTTVGVCSNADLSISGVTLNEVVIQV